jgi:hypothetical protein
MAVTSMSQSSILSFGKGNNVSGPKRPGIPWAEVSGGTETFVTINGIDYQVNKFTGNGTLTVSKAGYIDCLVVGGGASSKIDNSRSAGGGGGGVRFGLFFAPEGTEAVTIGAGGVGTSTNRSNAGSDSALGSVLFAGGGGWCVATPSNSDTREATDGKGGGGSPGGMTILSTGGNRNGGGAGGTPNGFNGITFNYDGTSREYGRGGDISGTTPVVNQGWGGPSGSNTSGSSGVVVVRIPV